MNQHRERGNGTPSLHSTMKGSIMQRQQKDHDIARMNSLTNAVTFLASIQDKLEADTELSDLALKIADKFYTWVIDGKPDPVQDAVDYVKEELGAETEEKQEEEAEPYRFNNYDRSDMPLSKKQRGYIIGLHKRIHQEPDLNQIDEMTTADASEFIEYLKSVAGDNGNGRRKARA